MHLDSIQTSLSGNSKSQIVILYLCITVTSIALAGNQQIASFSLKNHQKWMNVLLHSFLSHALNYALGALIH